MSQPPIAMYIAEINRERARLRRLLRAKDVKTLVTRPPSGEWSIVENVRHLLFAEQLHLGKFLPEGFEWSGLGLTQFTGRQFVDVGKRPTRDVEKVFQEWDAIHKPIMRAVRFAPGDVERALWRNHRHLGIHIRVIEKLLRRFDA